MLQNNFGATGSIGQRKERGASTIGLLLKIAGLGVLVYLGSQVITFYYSFYEIEGLMEFQAKKGQVIADAVMRRNIWDRIQQLQIPIDDPEQIRINRVEGKCIIDMSYSEVLYIDLGGKTYDLYVFKFNPHVEASY
jgi:hypothetical protein